MKVLISRKTGNYYYYNGIGEYHCKEGFLTEEQLHSGENILINSKQREFLIFEANKHDEFQKIKRGPQIITEKDLGYIIARSGIDKTSHIVEAGGGSGGATTFFGRICKSVHTYEIREDHCKIIETNLKKFELDNVELTLGDLAEHIETIDKDSLDLLFLDMPEPNMVLEKNLDALKSGRYVICYLPNVSQLLEVAKLIAEKQHLYIEEVTEVQTRHWRIWERVSRPEFRSDQDFTAFLMFLRKN
ncbi:MAG: methyltransferase domain-containing protein [Nanoarchaeales archaeon]|nr:methyltransferase domain-containing protein [Nanoarchaeales archaeon]